MKLSVLIGTTGKRKPLLRQVDRAYREDSWQSYDLEVIVKSGGTWGGNLNEAAKEATGDYWYLGTDDTAPWPGWFAAGRARLDGHELPVPRYFHPNGDPLHSWDNVPAGTSVPWCRATLLTPAMWEEIGGMMDSTWYADIRLSDQLRALGYDLKATDGFCFTHLGTERDWMFPGVTEYEQKLYEALRDGREPPKPPEGYPAACSSSV